MRRHAPPPPRLPSLSLLLAFYIFLLLLLPNLPAASADIASIWPPPSSASWPRAPGVRGNYTLDPPTFTVTSPTNSGILLAAIARYSSPGGLFFPFEATPAASGRLLGSLQVSVDSDAEVLYFGIDERYDIQVSDTGSALLHAATVFGALRGLETFAQLIDWKDQLKLYVMYDVPLVVLDAPRFPWRGLLIDTARHFIPVGVLQEAIDAMAWSKLNTLHWHLWDAKSVPLSLAELPRLALGAYSNATVYTNEDIQTIVQYGLQRGIRVVPELPLPGRTLSWGPAYPDQLALCLAAQFGEIVSLDPLAPETYDLLNLVMSALMPLFVDEYVSLGGEQTSFECWELLQPNASQTPVLSYFLNKVIGILMAQNFPRKVLNRFDAWLANPSTAAVVEVYRSSQSLSQVLSAGIPAISSAGWHVGSLVPVTPAPANVTGNDTILPYSGEFKDLFFPLPNGPAPTLLDFWNVDITQGITNATLLSRLLGGLMSVWSYEVDYTNLLSQTWPLAAVPAARLWTPADVLSKLSTEASQNQLSAFRCRLVQRGIDASAVRPDFCPLPPANQTFCPPLPPPSLPYGQYRLVHVALVGLFAGIVGIILGTILANCYRRLTKKLDAQNYQRRLINQGEPL